MQQFRSLTERRPRTVLLQGAIVVAVVAILGTLAGGAAPRPVEPDGTHQPRSSADGTLQPGPSGDEAWAGITLPPADALADLVATRPLGNRIATTTAFTIRSLGAIPVTDLASRIQADPPVSLVVEPGATPDTATLVPTGPLLESTRYRFRLTAPDGSLAGTWAFRTDSPLHVVSRLPDDQTNDVPVDTGIETTFDQDSPIGFADHFSIEPAAAGRFERHGRTWVFAPTKPLAPATIYTVRITRGVGLSGSDRILESDVAWQFETAPADGATQGIRPAFARDVVEFRPGDAPAILVAFMNVDEESGQTIPAKVPYELYRLASFAAAASAAEQLLGEPTWADWTTAAIIDTSHLRRVADGTAPISSQYGPDYGIELMRLPVHVDAGWYVLVIPDATRPAQAILQVTDLSAYVLTTETRLAAWVNDLATVGPVAGATLATTGGTVLGTTNDGGLLTAPTPASLVNSQADGTAWSRHVLTIAAPDGRRLLVPLGIDAWGYPSEDNGVVWDRGPTDDWWFLFSTDRTTYRDADTVHSWGVIRSRADLSIPNDLELRLSVTGQSASAPLVRTPVVATSRGVFSGDLSFDGLPHGSYEVTLYAGSKLIQSTWIDVAEIRKPAYVIEVTTDRRAYVAGDAMSISGAVRFYDGSRAPGLSLVVQSEYQDLAFGRVTTDADGRFSLRVKAPAPDGEAWVVQDISARPTAPEEGEISGRAEVAVFAAGVWLDGTATLADGRLTVDAVVSRVDFDSIEAQMANGAWFTDPAGTPVVGRAVAARVVHVVPVRTQVGTTYDFIAKKVVPLYEYSTHETTLATRTLTSGDGGAVHMALDVPAPKDEYRVELTAHDGQGRATHRDLYAGQSQPQFTRTQPYLVAPGGCGWAQLEAPLGATSDLTVYEADGSVAADGRYLFLVGEQGLVDATLQAGATYQRTFRQRDLPSYTARAVRFTATGYQATDPVLVRVEPASKTLGVTLRPQQARYAPGDLVTLDVRTVGPDGRPMAADVIVRAIDEKLFTIGDALDVDALGELLASQGSGFLQSFTSHPIPVLNDGGCGGAGGARGDFRDSATFQHVQTGADGRATVSFRVPDDLTSWHVTATAVSGALDAGSANVLVPVGLPFFVDAIIAPAYLTGETPVAVVRAYGDATQAGDPVTIVVRSPDLGLAPVTVQGHVGEALRVALPSLPAGDHRVTIEAHAGAGAFSDTLIRTIHVIPTRLRALQASEQSLAGAFTAVGGPGLTTYVVSDAGRGSLVPILGSILGSDGARFDQAATADLARQLLIDEFSVDPATLPPSQYDATRYAHNGVSLLPYSSADLALTAMAAIAAPERIDREDARSALWTWANDPDVTRERRIIALAGQAALGEDVLDELRAVIGTELTVREQLWLGLGLYASGDETAARTIERQVLADHGQRLDPWVRLDVASTLDETLEGTALMLVLAGQLGDPLAAAMDRYLASQPSREHLFTLERLAYVRGGLDRLPRAAASFAWSIDGERHEVTLGPGEAHSMTLTAGQRATLSLQRLTGDLVVNAAWIGDAAAADLPSAPGITITRTVSPADAAPPDELVQVRLTVSFSSSVPTGCYDVTDLLPSGLAPVVSSPGWPDDPEVIRNAYAPYAVDGQRVSWCVDPSDRRTWQLAYSARVVSPGTYRWEPAVIQSTIAVSLGAATPATTFTIR
jgi:alpha-2-macroglobulin